MSNTTDVYTWNDDGTLASFPGPGYNRLLAYNDSKQLVSITRDYGGGNQVLAYEYGYGADGGRRWKKDHAADVWTWYPCGVACSAGELVEQQSDLTGATWTTSAVYLQGQGIVSRAGEYHHFDNRGTAGVITDISGSVLSNNLYDSFGVARYTNGSAQTPWRWQQAQVADEGLLNAGDSGTYVVAGVSTASYGGPVPPSSPIYAGPIAGASDPPPSGPQVVFAPIGPNTPIPNPGVPPPGPYFPIGVLGPGISGYVEPPFSDPPWVLKGVADPGPSGLQLIIWIGGNGKHPTSGGVGIGYRFPGIPW